MGEAQEKFGVLISAINQTSAGFASVLSNTKSMASSLTSIITTPFKAMANPASMAAIFNVEAISNALGSLYEKVEARKQAEAKLGAVIQATGHAAGFSTQALKDYASQMSKSTLFSSTDLLGSEAILATFKEIRGPVFKEAMTAMLDMSTVMSQDLKASAVQLGKALNDPVQGMTALRRVGVSFTQAQEDQVKSLVESNRLYQAQAIILAELKSEFGGAALAVAEGAGGRINQLKKAMGGLTMDVAMILEPAVIAVTDFIHAGVGRVKTFLDAARDMVLNNFSKIQGALSIGFSALGSVIGSTVTSLFSSVENAFNRMGLMKAVIGFAAKLPVYLGRALVESQDVIQLGAALCFKVFADLLDNISGIMDRMKRLTRWVFGTGDIAKELHSAANAAREAGYSVGTMFGTPEEMNKRRDALKASIVEIEANVHSLVNHISGVRLWANITDGFGAAVGMMRGLAGGFGGVISNMFFPTKSAEAMQAAAKKTATEMKKAAEETKSAFEKAADVFDRAADKLMKARGEAVNFQIKDVQDTLAHRQAMIDARGAMLVQRGMPQGMVEQAKLGEQMRAMSYALQVIARAADQPALQKQWAEFTAGLAQSLRDNPQVMGNRRMFGDVDQAFQRARGVLHQDVQNQNAVAEREVQNARILRDEAERNLARAKDDEVRGAKASSKALETLASVTVEATKRLALAFLVPGMAGGGMNGAPKNVFGYDPLAGLAREYGF